MTGAEVRALQRIVQEAWRSAGPKVEWHVGDVAWMRWQHAGREREWKLLVLEDGWGWRRGGTELQWLVRPEAKGSPTQRRLLEWFEEEADRIGPLRTWAFEDDGATAELLVDAGFALESAGRRFTFNVRELGDEPPPHTPDGFVPRTVREDELHRRVELHRAVWHPSRVSEESYANVQRAWPYRRDLDCVVEAPDGRLAAYALAWYDDANRVGELEPVGTHPDFRRLGLGAAACRYALRRLREAGARLAVVYSADDPAQRLYESVGFGSHARLVPYAKIR